MADAPGGGSLAFTAPSLQREGRMPEQTPRRGARRARARTARVNYRCDMTEKLPIHPPFKLYAVQEAGVSAGGEALIASAWMSVFNRSSTAAYTSR